MWGVQRHGKLVRLTGLRGQFESGHVPPSSIDSLNESPPAALEVEDLPLDEDLDQDAPDPADVKPAPAPAEDSTEDPGLITLFGMFWRRDQVDWGNRNRILGHKAGNETEVDFAGQIVLHDGAHTVYVGRVSKPRMGQRLFEHTKDRLSGRWDRFSWFGLRPVLNRGVLVEPAATFGTDLVVATMEAILIEGLEPPQNRRQGDGMMGQEYQQIVDEQLRERHAMATMLRVSQGRHKS